MFSRLTISNFAMTHGDAAAYSRTRERHLRQIELQTLRQQVRPADLEVVFCVRVRKAVIPVRVDSLEHESSPLLGGSHAERLNESSRLE